MSFFDSASSFGRDSSERVRTNPAPASRRIQTGVYIVGDTLGTLRDVFINRLKHLAAIRRHLGFVPGSGAGAFSVSQNGLVVYQPATDGLSQLAWFDRSGRSRRAGDQRCNAQRRGERKNGVLQKIGD